MIQYEILYSKKIKLLSKRSFILYFAFIMHTTQLKKQHSQVYQNFFNNYDLVISLPQVLLLTGKSYSTRWKGTSLGIKLPLRLYLGVNFTQNQNKQIPFIFKKNSYSEFQQGILEHFYDIDRLLLQEIAFDYKIGFLAEYNNFPKNYFINLIALAEYLIENPKIHTKKIKNIQNKEITYNTTQGIKMFYQKNKKALKFTLKNQYPHRWLSNISMTQGDTFWLIEDRERYTYKNIAEEKKYYNNVFNYYIINKNLPYNIPQNENTLQNRYQQIKKFTKQKQREYEESIIQWLANIEKHFSYEISKNIQELSNNKSQGKDLFYNISSYNKIYQLFSQKDENKIKEAENYKEYLNKYIPYINNPKHMSIIFNQNIEIFSHKFIYFEQKQIDQINKNHNLNLTIDYASDKDGFEKKWREIDQRKTKKHYSEFCSEYQLKTFENENMYQESTDYHHILQSKEGLLLDSIDNKIYLFGQKLTSKTLRSQSATIELFKILLKNIDNEIENDELPSSSYSKNKNEMLWKIILPLRNIIQEKVGKKLDIQCHGSLWKFAIQLKKSPIKIQLIEKR